MIPLSQPGGLNESEHEFEIGLDQIITDTRAGILRTADAVRGALGQLPGGIEGPFGATKTEIAQKMHEVRLMISILEKVDFTTIENPADVFEAITMLELLRVDAREDAENLVQKIRAFERFISLKNLDHIGLFAREELKELRRHGYSLEAKRMFKNILAKQARGIPVGRQIIDLQNYLRKHNLTLGYLMEASSQ